MTLAQVPEQHMGRVLELFRDRILDLSRTAGCVTSPFSKISIWLPQPCKDTLIRRYWERRSCRNCWRLNFVGAAPIS